MDALKRPQSIDTMHIAWENPFPPLGEGKLSVVPLSYRLKQGMHQNKPQPNYTGFSKGGSHNSRLHVHYHESQLRNCLTQWQASCPCHTLINGLRMHMTVLGLLLNKQKVLVN